MVLEGIVILHLRHIGRGLGEIARLEMEKNKEDLMEEHHIRSVDKVDKIVHTAFLPSEKLLLRARFRCTVRVFSVVPGSVIVGAIVGHFVEGLVLGAADGAVRVLVTMGSEETASSTSNDPMVTPSYAYINGHWVRKCNGVHYPITGDLRCRVVEIVHRSREMIKCFAVPE